ncbi:hypothetical protein [Mesorhizobium sp. B4-1-4]|uniref:AtuA-related protein n=1 Tax=Mesorhizobium sp. B4-1-4 TaxID=2589888 RepID=UPI0011271158|nr:hypothetical protein [Mesorhizobium sp. B4-1-4]UCI31978.1 hypothetical protein FJW03_00445 [Mesorhizobium sp. B4-1-4]
MTTARRYRLYDLVHARSGDKGNRLNIGVFCNDTELFGALREPLSAEFVRGVFRHRNPSSVVRYELPKLSAFNFVLDGVLEGGVNVSLGLDGHGKTLSYLLLSASLEESPALRAFVEGRKVQLAI